MKIETRPTFLEGRFTPGPHCRPFDARPFLMRLCVAGDGLRSRWVGQCWVHDPVGREVLVRVVLLETLAGEFFVASAPTEADAVPLFVRLGAFLNPDDAQQPAFTTGPADFLGAGEWATLSVRSVM